MSVTLTNLIGPEIEAHMDALAALRIGVFREYPYLYDGDADSERKYLGHYARHGDSLCVLATDGEQVVGASTAMWMNDADPAFRACFDRNGIATDSMFYFGESVLLPDYRGRGLGHRFFDAREEHALARGAITTAFCAVDRPPDHPAKPVDYRSLYPFWSDRGYEHHPHLSVEFPWREPGDPHERLHPMSFWIRYWETLPR